MTIKEIAKLANVSISTVSKVINKKDKEIGIDTRHRVLKIIEENNYIPYSKYIKVDLLTNGLVGLIINAHNEKYKEVVLEIEKELKNFNLKLVIYNTNGSLEDIQNGILELKKKNTAGLIIECNEEIELDNNIFYFYKDYKKIARLINEISNVYQRIIYVYDKKNTDILEASDKLQGFSYISDKENILSTILSNNNILLLCENANICLEYYRILNELKLKIPEDVAILSLDDNDILTKIYEISAISYPLVDKVKNTTLNLIHSLNDKEPLGNVDFEPRVILKKSLLTSRIKSNEKKIVVVGTMNTDTLIIGSTIPTNGKTQIAKNVLKLAGGKGGNQAVGVALLGVNVSIIAKIGRDLDGLNLLENLKKYNVSTEAIEIEDNIQSGKAFIQIDKNGENTIVVCRGANDKLAKDQLERQINFLKEASFCLLSSEITSDMVIATIEECKKNNVKIIFKPTTLDKIGFENLKDIDYFIPNIDEINSFNLKEKTLEKKCIELLSYGIKNVIVTLGEKGAYLKNEKDSLYFPSAPFTAKDTTGGADSFISALAVSLCENNDLIYSIIYANYAAGITVTQFGVQDAMPSKEIMNIYKEDINKMYSKIKGEILK